jgi:hypothetical protein
MNEKLAHELERIAQTVDLDVAEDTFETLMEAAAELRKPSEVEVVEQGVLNRAPDGWSWTDIGEMKNGGFTGFFTGVRLTKGEPIPEQAGHYLVLRQGETALSPIHERHYRLLSLAAIPGDDGKLHGPEDEAVSVMVVHGFQGARVGYTLFRAGEIEKTIWTGGSAGITSAIRGWLERSHANPIVKRPVHREKKPDQGTLA